MLFKVVFALFISILLTSNARAFTLSATVEAITIPSVGAAFQTVNFENTYVSPVPVCIYNLPTTGDASAVVRIQGISATGMQILIQQPSNTSAVTAGTVFCLVAETGVTVLPDGRRIEARSVLSTVTHGRNVPAGFNNASIPTMINASGLFSGFTSAIALGQVITFNDPDFSGFHANDCENRGNPPFLGGFGNGICITKHVGEDNSTRASETLGVIVIERGIGSFAGIAYESTLGADTIDGVNNNGNTYALSSGFEFAVATLAGEDGGDGGRAVFLGGGAVGGTTLTLAIDEDIINDPERAHTTENVAYFAVRRLPIATATKNVDRPSIAETLTLNYEIIVENSGQLDQTGVVVSDILPGGSAGTVSGPVESTNTDGILAVGETFTFTVSYVVTPADIIAGVDLINNVSVTSDQYTAESLADVTASATTVIVPGNPSITVTKSSDQLGANANVPAGVTITYTYVVRNTGNQFITNISLDDDHDGSGPDPAPRNEALSDDGTIIDDSNDGTPDDGIWDSLAPGDEITFTGTYVVTQNDVDTLQ